MDIHAETQNWVNEYFLPELQEKINQAKVSGADLSNLNEQQIIRVCAKLVAHDIRVILDSKEAYDNLLELGL